MDANLLMTQITAGAACAYLLQLLQKWEKVPWITQHTVYINTGVRAVLALLAVVGITEAWTPNPGGGGVLAFTIPPATVILHGIWHWFGQYALQHGWGKILDVDGQPSLKT